MSRVHQVMAAFTAAIILFFAFFGTVFAQMTTGDTYSSSYGYRVVTPPNWNTFTKEFTALKGGEVERVIIAQQTDLVSRTTKYFALYAGSPSSVFGLSPKVVDRLTHDEIVDFFIDQETNANIDNKVTKTSVIGDGDAKVYVIESNHAVPGYREFTIDHITFKNGKVYLWSTQYLGPFANYANTLQQISDSVHIN